MPMEATGEICLTALNSMDTLKMILQPQAWSLVKILAPTICGLPRARGQRVREALRGDAQKLGGGFQVRLGRPGGHARAVLLRPGHKRHIAQVQHGRHCLEHRQLLRLGMPTRDMARRVRCTGMAARSGSQHQHLPESYGMRTVCCPVAVPIVRMPCTVSW